MPAPCQYWFGSTSLTTATPPVWKKGMKGHGRALRLLLEIRQVILNFSLLHVSKLKTRELTEIEYLI